VAWLKHLLYKYFDRLVNFEERWLIKCSRFSKFYLFDFFPFIPFYLFLLTLFFEKFHHFGIFLALVNSYGAGEKKSQMSATLNELAALFF